MNTSRVILPGASIFSAMSLWAADPAPADKRHYHLFNPTPRELLREMSTDRPDVTESAFTVDAGHRAGARPQALHQFAITLGA